MGSAAGERGARDRAPRLVVTWEQIMAFARTLEQAAFHDHVAPADGARLVRLVLMFDEHIVDGVRTPGRRKTE